MLNVRHFFRRVKRRLLHDAINVLQDMYQPYIDNDPNPNDVMLNIGAGNWYCKGWTNLDYPTEWYSAAQKKHPFIPYDIRSDKIPFEAETVSAVYCSHVIEHIEDEFVSALFADVHRVLKAGGVFRIACPDSEFLYEVSQPENEYWHWRKGWFNSPRFVRKAVSPSQVDYLVREIATPKFPEYVNAIESDREDYTACFKTMGMNEFLEHMTSGLVFRKDFPGDHINWWTFAKARDMLTSAGFSVVIRSKYLGSMCRAMCNPAKFDVTCPCMSLYVEAMK